MSEPMKISVEIEVQEIADEIIRKLTEDETLVEVVRCKDCENWGKQKTVGGFAKCSLDAAWHGPEFYCANGVKRA